MCALSLQPDNFIAFGLSGSAQRTQMVRGDATMTWLDNEGVHAQDLDLTAYSQVVMIVDILLSSICSLHVCKYQDSARSAPKL